MTFPSASTFFEVTVRLRDGLTYYLTKDCSFNHQVMITKLRYYFGFQMRMNAEETKESIYL